MRAWGGARRTEDPITSFLHQKKTADLQPSPIRARWSTHLRFRCSHSRLSRSTPIRLQRLSSNRFSPSTQLTATRAWLPMTGFLVVATDGMTRVRASCMLIYDCILSRRFGEHVFMLELCFCMPVIASRPDCCLYCSRWTAASANRANALRDL